MIRGLLTISIFLSSAVCFAEMTNSTNSTIPALESQPSSYKSKDKNTDLKYIDPRTKDKSSTWEYSENKQVKWKYEDKAKEELNQKQKALKKVESDKAQKEKEASKTIIEHPSKKDLSFKPAKIIKRQSFNSQSKATANK